MIVYATRNQLVTSFGWCATCRGRLLAGQTIISERHEGEHGTLFVHTHERCPGPRAPQPPATGTYPGRK